MEATDDALAAEYESDLKVILAELRTASILEYAAELRAAIDGPD